MSKSFKAEVLTCDGSWSSNQCRFATKEEAEASGQELLSRWTVPIDHRATESDDPVNYRFNFDTEKNERLQLWAARVLNLETNESVEVGRSYDFDVLVGVLEKTSAERGHEILEDGTTKDQTFLYSIDLAE